MSTLNSCAQISQLTQTPTRNRIIEAFFANLVAGKPADKCGAVTHDTASIGGLVTIGPLALTCALKGDDLSDIQNLCRSHLYLTHPSDALGVVCDYYVELLYRLLYRTDESPQDILEDIALRGNHLSLAKLVAKNKSDIEIVGRQFSPACYISDAWPSVLYFAYRYVENGKKHSQPTPMLEEITCTVVLY